MTFIGKILVVAIAFFAILFMGFAVTVYATRTNWRDKYADVKKQKDELDNRKKSLEGIVNGLSADLSEEVKRHKTERDTYQKNVADQKINYDVLHKDHTQAKEELTKALAQLRLMQDEVAARRDEAARIRAMWVQTQADKEKAMKKQFETEQKNIELTGLKETLDARVKELEERNLELASILRARGIPAESIKKEALAIQNPPPVEGVVLDVDKEGKFVQISVGSDDGLRKLHRLDVYRLNPKGKYVGRIEITAIEPDKAVARILPQFKQGNIQNGDLVATRFTASR